MSKERLIKRRRGRAAPRLIDGGEGGRAGSRKGLKGAVARERSMGGEEGINRERIGAQASGRPCSCRDCESATFSVRWISLSLSWGFSARWVLERDATLCLFGLGSTALALALAALATSALAATPSRAESAPVGFLSGLSVSCLASSRLFDAEMESVAGAETPDFDG